MPIDFPTSPATGQVYTYLGKSWIWNGTGWDVPKALSEIGAVRTFANAAARTAAIPSPTEGIVTYLNDVDRLDVHNGTAFVTIADASAWTTFTPVINGLTVGNGVYNYSKFKQIGKTVNVQVRFTLGTTSAVTGEMTLDVPSEIARVALAAPGNVFGFFKDNSANTFSLSTITTSAASAARWFLRPTLSSGTYLSTSATTSTIPFTWGNTDEIAFTATYEVA
jgi:hypothetical protein